MTTDLEDRVRAALAARADRTTITPGAVFDGRTPLADEGRRRQRVPVAAAAVAVVIGGAGAIAFIRSDTPTPATGTIAPAQTSPSDPPFTGVPLTEPAVDGATTMPGLGGAPLVHVGADSGFAVVDATPSENCPRCFYDPEREFGPPSWRVYAIGGERPDDGPAIVTVGHEDIVGTPGPHGTSVPIRGVAGELSDMPSGGRQLSFFVDGFLYFLYGYKLSDEELVAIGERAEPAPDGHGVLLDPASLPVGVELQFEGWNDTVFLSPGATTRATLEHEESGATAQFFSVPGVATANLSRSTFDTVSDVEVGIFAGYVGEFDTPGSVRVLVWPNGDRTMVLQSTELTADQLVALAESLEFG